ncbi:hypothetical protein D9611_009122 [Ephemerocybe angulata]|uniref:Uncharacterized protein n=1 Tax=Ephemerocybe angulata TaxID=980116 RepID=A0A8H5FK75_9AGAR|nr:hypothetical protein D9611_009122 [Tulosesus angulatus]
MIPGHRLRLGFEGTYRRGASTFGLHSDSDEDDYDFNPYDSDSSSSSSSSSQSSRTSSESHKLAGEILDEFGSLRFKMSRLEFGASKGFKVTST